MSRGRRTLLLGVTMLVAAGAGVVAVTRSNALADSSPRARARVLYFQALDARVRFDRPETQRLLRASLLADSSYLPAILETVNFYGSTFMTRDAMEELGSLADRQDDSVRAECLRTIVEATKMGFFRRTYASPRPTDDCNLFVFLTAERGLEREERAEGWLQLVRRYPEDWTFWHNALSNLPIVDAQDEHTALVTEMMQPNRHPLF